MAKELKQPAPSSSIANILDDTETLAATGKTAARPVVAERPTGQAVAPLRPSPVAEAPATPTRPTGELADIVRQYQLTPTTDGHFNQLHMMICAATRARLPQTSVYRALLHAVGNALPQLEREAQRIGRLRVPKNAKGYEAQRDELEEIVAAAITAGMRAAPEFDPQKSDR
jgi:hypothetical protein